MIVRKKLIEIGNLSLQKLLENSQRIHTDVQRQSCDDLPLKGLNFLIAKQNGNFYYTIMEFNYRIEKILKR